MVGLRVGEHLVAFVAAERSGRGDELLGLAEQAQQRVAPAGAIGLEDGELLGGGVAVGLRLDVQVELPRRDRGGRDGWLNGTVDRPDTAVAPGATATTRGRTAGSGRRHDSIRTSSPRRDPTEATCVPRRRTDSDCPLWAVTGP